MEKLKNMVMNLKASAKISSVRIKSNKDMPCEVELTAEGEFSIEETLLLCKWLDYQCALVSLNSSYVKGLISKEDKQIEEKKYQRLFNESFTLE